MGIKQNDIRMALQDKVEPALLHALCGIVEEQQAMKQQILEMAQSIDMMSGIITDMVGVAENMKSVTDSMRKVDGEGNVNMQFGTGKHQG
jgi:hypothetical protein